MQETSHEGRMFETFIYLNKIPLAEVSENTNMTNGDVYSLFSFDKIPDESKKQIAAYLGRTFESIMDDNACKTELIRLMKTPDYQKLIALREVNDQKEKSIRAMIGHIRDTLEE